MEPTSISHEGDGATTAYSIHFPYLRREHVTATVDGVNTPFTFVAPSIVAFDEAPREGAAVVIRRSTQSSALVDFAGGAALTEEDLDTANLQSLYLYEEAADRMSLIEKGALSVELPDLSELPAIYADALGEAPDDGSSDDDFDFLEAYKGTAP